MDEADAEVGDEHTPLLKAQRRASAHIDWWREFLHTYEPVDEGAEDSAEHPAALLLLGMHLGMASIQICSVLGAYMQLVSNADLIFPECSKHSLLDRLFGLHTRTGILCEVTSLCLWTFPLLCCTLISLFEYWDFCHSRLYYDCLRARMLLVFPDKDLLESPVFYFVVGVLVVGIATAVFTSADIANFFRAVFPPLFPVFSFIATMYVQWDIKYYLITLPNLVKHVGWSKTFLKECIDVTESQLEQAYQKKVLMGWEGTTSMEVFLELRREAVQVISRATTWEEELAINRKKAVALVCGGRGWWVSDLLWIPTDMRAEHFRFAFRLFAFVCIIILACLLLMFLSTCLTYQVLTGKLTYDDIYPFGFLQHFMIDHTNDTAELANNSAELANNLSADVAANVPDASNITLRFWPTGAAM